jgi:hypothetical protein
MLYHDLEEAKTVAEANRSLMNYYGVDVDLLNRLFIIAEHTLKITSCDRKTIQSTFFDFVEKHSSYLKFPTTQKKKVR